MNDDQNGSARPKLSTMRLTTHLSAVRRVPRVLFYPAREHVVRRSARGPGDAKPVVGRGRATARRRGVRVRPRAHRRRAPPRRARRASDRARTKDLRAVADPRAQRRARAGAAGTGRGTVARHVRRGGQPLVPDLHVAQVSRRRGRSDWSKRYQKSGIGSRRRSHTRRGGDPRACDTHASRARCTEATHAGRRGGHVCCCAPRRCVVRVKQPRSRDARPAGDVAGSPPL